MGKAQYILLDCDNTLCKSEHLAFEACADLTNEVLEKHGLPQRYTGPSLLEDFVGYNFRKMLEALQEKLGFTMSPDELEEYVGKELDRVTQKLSEKAVECDGVTTQLEWMKAQGYPMSVVSTSAKSRVVASLDKCNLSRFFPKEHVYSAATSLTPPSSKPDPAIYNFACKELGVENAKAITVEDSKSGATAAQRAGIPCIGYVGIYREEEGEKKEAEMAKILTEVTGCKAIMYNWSEFPEILAKIEKDL